MPTGLGLSVGSGGRRCPDGGDRGGEGSDLLLSAAQQIYLYHLLGFKAPEWHHLPLLTNSGGIRLSKRDASLSMEAMRASGASPAMILGRAAAAAGLIPEAAPAGLDELIDAYRHRYL